MKCRYFSHLEGNELFLKSHLKEVFNSLKTYIEKKMCGRGQGARISVGEVGADGALLGTVLQVFG